MLFQAKPELYSYNSHPPATHDFPQHALQAVAKEDLNASNNNAPCSRRFLSSIAHAYGSLRVREVLNPRRES